MSRPSTLQGRLSLWLGVTLTLLWIAAAGVTAIQARHEMEEVFDAALQETAQRILPLAVIDIVGREEEGVTQRLGAVSNHVEFFTYVVRDDQGRILLQSHAADPAIFPEWDGTGFRQSATHRFYNEQALQGSIRMTVAEPLAHRTHVAREIQMGLGLPLLIVIPAALLAIALAVRASLAPLRRFRERLAARDARDLSVVPAGDLPAEVLPMAAALNDLLRRLGAAFEAERSFAANAAHELRTPLAGAIAQSQRLQSETRDPVAKARASEIEATLKRLTRLSERLMQLARAEGSRLLLDRPADLRPVARILTEELARVAGEGRISLALPEQPVMSNIDPDAFAIVFRNLVENALRHGSEDVPIEVSLSEDAMLNVANDGPTVSPEVLDRLTNRFEQGGTTSMEGSGLGLAIVAAIAERTDRRLVLKSPRTGRLTGFEAQLSVR